MPPRSEATRWRSVEASSERTPLQPPCRHANRVTSEFETSRRGAAVPRRTVVSAGQAATSAGDGMPAAVSTSRFSSHARDQFPGAIVGLLVVDDQVAFRALARDVVAATPGFAVVAEARSGEEAIEAAQS